jgi:LacI family transcriptional regulator
VAAQAGVSRTTVSLVLNDVAGAAISDATRQRVLEAAERLGYQPHHSARGLAGGKSHTLGLVLRQSPEQVATDAFLPETLRGLAAAARAGGYRVLVEPVAPGHEGYVELVRSGRTDGLVLSGPRIDDRDLATIIDEGFPIVLQGSLPGVDVPSVDIDNEAGARSAVEHLLALGHRRIGCITNAPLAYTAARERLAGFHAALAGAGLAAEPELIAEGSFDAPSGRTAMESMLHAHPPTAVFVASDVVALGAIAAIRDAGLRVPDDLSVVGFDDVPLAAYFDPPLTTIRLPAHELGFAAGRALLERIRGRPVPARMLLPTELVVRGSSGPPRMEPVGRGRDP